MAKYGKSLAEVKVYINGREQAQKELDILKASAATLGQQLDEVNDKMLDASKRLAEARERANQYSGNKDSAEYKAAVDDELRAQDDFDKASKSASQYRAELKQVNKAITETERLNVNLEEALAHLSEQDLVRLRKIKREVTAVRDKVKGSDDPDMEYLNLLNKALEEISDTIKRKMGTLVEFEDIMGKITHVDDRTLEGVIKRLKDLIATTDKLEVEKLKKYKEELAQAEGVQKSRTFNEGQSIIRKVQGGNYKNTVEGTQEDIKSLEKYMKTLDTADSDALKEVNSVMDQLKQNIKETESGFMSFEKAMEKAQGIMSGTFDPTLDDLEQIQKVLKEGMQNKFRIANPEDEAQLKQTLGLMEEMLKKQKEVMRLNHQDKVDAVSGKLDKVSPAEIEEAVKAAKELQQVAKTKEEFIQLGEFIGKAEARLKDWNETSKQSVMKSQIKDLSAIRALSDGALQDQLKFWEGTMNAAKKTSTAYKEAKKNFEDLQAESKRRLQFEGEKTISDVKLGVGDGSTKQMQERLKLLQDYRAVIDGTKPDAYKEVDEAILKLTEDIKASQAGFLSFDKALERAKQISEGTFKPTLEDLEQVQKVLKEGMQSKFNLVDDADIDKLKETRRLMDEMAKKQAEADRIRLKDQATEIMGGDYTKTIEGTKQAIEILKKYQDTLDTTKPDAINEVTKAINKMKEELESASRAKAAEVMADPMNFSADEINEAIKLTEKLQAATNNATVWENYEQQLIKAREARDRFADDSKYKAMVKQFEDLEHLTANAWAEQKKYWEAMRDSGKHYDEAIKKLAEMQELETNRMKASSTETLTTDLMTAGTDEIKQSVEWLTKYQASLEPLGDEWTDINNLIKAGEERLKSITETVSKQNLSEQAGKIMGGDYTKTIEGTKQAIEILKKYQQTLDATDTKGINKVEESIKKMREELDTVTKKNAREILTTNLKVAGTEDIKQAVEWLSKYQGTLKPLSPLWKKINKEIEAGNERLKELSDGKKMAAMTEQFKKYKDLSVNALAEQKKYWTEVKNTHAETDKEYKRAVARLEKIDELEKSRTKAEATPLITEATSGTWDKTIEETEKAIKLIQEYKKQLHTSTDAAAIADADKAIASLNANLGKLKDNTKLEYMNAQLSKVSILSKSALLAQKKFWQEMIDGARLGSTEMDTYKQNLKEVENQIDRVTRQSGKDIVKDVLRGAWEGSISQAKEALKALQEYKESLKTTDTNAIRRADAAIEALTNKTKLAEAGIKDVDSSLKLLVKQSEKLGTGDYKGSIVGLENMRKKLMAIRDAKDSALSADERDSLEKALRNVNKELSIMKGEAVDVEHVLANMKDTPLWKLEKAAKQLQEEIRDCSETTGDFAKKAAELRQVNAQIDKLKKQFKDTGNIIEKTIKRLAAYVAVYGGFNYVKDRIQEVIHSNLQLSDSIADVQKTTGLSAEKLGQLGEEIRAIDTRTSQEQLYQLAAAAGQLGLKSETDIAGFVRAANMITVSLNELGTEATAQLMKIATLTGEIQEGTEKAMLSIGSAINELTANSAAAAGPIVDLMNRMGGVAAQANLTSAQMAAIGATADALGQSMEITGTSLNKFLTTLVSNTDQIAYALNMDAKSLRAFINESRTMDAVVAVFERMNQMGGLENLAGVMGDLGSEGARMTQVLAALASNVNFLKGQLDISTTAYEKATSIQDEYNVKNENAIAILQRMGNEVKELFVNNIVVDGITAILRAMYQFGEMMKGVSGWAQSLTAVFGGLTAALIANKIAWLQNIQARTAGFWSFTLADKIGYLKLVLIDCTKAIWTNIKALSAWTVQLFTTRKAIDAVKVAWGNFTKFLQTNWITIVIAALGALAVWIYKIKTYVSEAAKATAKYNRELQEEKDKVDQLFNSLKRLNTKEEDRARIISEINNQYQQYLGFMLDEKDSADKLAAAHQLINAELRKRMALNLQSTLTGKATNTYAEELEKTIADIGTKVGNINVGIVKQDGSMEQRELYTSDVMQTISEMINDRVYNAVKVTSEEVNGQIVYKQQFEGIDLNALKVDVKKALKEQFKDIKMLDEDGNILEDRSVGQAVYTRIESYIENLVNDRIDYQKKIIAAEQQANIELRSAAKDVLKRREAFNETVVGEIEKAKESSAELEQNLQEADKKLKSAKEAAKKFGKGDTSKEAKAAKENLKTAEENYANEERKLKDHYMKMADNANDYVENQREILKAHYANVDSMEEGEQKEQLKKERDQINEQIALYENFAKEIVKKVPNYDPWGKERDVKDWKEFADIVTNIDTSSANALAAAFKKIKEEGAQITDVDKFYKMFEGTGLENMGLDTPEKVAKQLFEWEKQIREKLKTKYHRNTSLGFIFDESDGGAKKTANEMYKEWLAELEAFYNERETIIRQNGMKEGKLETEINRQIEALTTEKLTMQRELEEGLLSDLYEGSTFDPTKFEGVITKTKYFANLTLEEMRKIVAAGGPKLDAEIRKNMTNRMVKIEEQAYKIKQRINKILLEDDFTGKVAKEYLDSLDELGLLFNIEMESQSDRTKEEGERRLTYMKEWAKEAYLIDSQGLENLIASNDAFSKWRIGRTQEDYEALLVMLRKYHDDMAEAENRAAQRRKRILDKQWSAKSTDSTKVSDGKDKQSVSISKSTSEFISTKVNDKQIKDLKEKISVEKNTIEVIKERTKVEIDAARESMELAEQELWRAQRDGNATKEQIDNYNSSKKKYEELVASREKYILESSERIAKHEENIQTRILEIRVANSNESQDMEELLQAEIEKEEERVKLVYERMKTELAAAKMSMIIAEQEKNMAERTGENIKEHTDKYIQAKEAYEKLTAEFNNLTKDSVSKIVEYKQIIEVGAPNKKKTRLEAADDKIKGEEADLKMYESARDLGLASERRVEDAQIAVLQARIDKEKEYINFIYERMQAEIDVAEQEMVLAKQQYDNLAAQGIEDKEAKEKMLATEQAYQSLLNQRTQITQESNEKIKEYELEIEAVQLQTTQRKMETLKGYTDAVVSFGEQMGEAAFGEVEDRKEAARQLLKTTLQLTKDLLMAEAQRLIMKKVLGQKEIIQEQTKETAITTNKGSSAITNLTVETAETGGKVALGQAGGAAKIIGELGWWGIPLIAVINAALSALMGAAMSAVSKSKDEIASATGTRKLSTGMLTYAEGNYPVLGNDGKVYDAKYEGAGMKTGVYGGGAHFGIFSERQPEMIVDGKTTQKIILNYPYIYDAITTIAKNGRLKNAMPTFATGDYPAGMKQLAPIAEVDASAGSNEQMERMSAALEQNSVAFNQLTKLLQGGITAHLDGLETHKQQKKNERFLKRRGID